MRGAVEEEEGMPSAVRAKHSLDTKHLQNKRYRSCFVFLSLLLFFASCFSIPNRILYLQKSIDSSSSSFSSFSLFSRSFVSLTIQYPNEDENESRRRRLRTQHARTSMRGEGGGRRNWRNKTRQSGIAAWLDPGVHGPRCVGVYTTREKPNVSCTSDHHKEKKGRGRVPTDLTDDMNKEKKKSFICHLRPLLKYFQRERKIIKATRRPFKSLITSGSFSFCLYARRS